MSVLQYAVHKVSSRMCFPTVPLCNTIVCPEVQKMPKRCPTSCPMTLSDAVGSQHKGLVRPANTAAAHDRDPSAVVFC